MSTILLSIKPEYVKKIFEGTKKYEFRKSLAKKNVKRIIIYSTYPEMKVVGEARVKRTITMPKTPLWELTKNYAGICRSKYREYFNNCNQACAYELEMVKKYDSPRQLEHYNLSQAPQSFVYLKECPFCENVIMYSDLCNCSSEEHILPKSIGNDELIIPKGIICDGCNNYFAREIEKPFLENENIKRLRTYHTIPSRKDNIPPLEILLNNTKATLRFDNKKRINILELDPDTTYKIIKKEISPTSFISKGISVDSLQNSYVVSRFLVKVFVEICLYYTNLCNTSDQNSFYLFDSKMRELFDYVRKGNRNKRVYKYTVVQNKEVVPFANDDFVASIGLNFDEKRISGMTLSLFELNFELLI